MLAAILTICGTAAFASCATNDDNPSGQAVESLYVLPHIAGSDIDKPEVRVMVNPGGLNEKFANEKLPHATIIVWQKNEEIPNQVTEDNADVMITEITEAPWYVQNDPRLAAPLLNAPFTHGEISVLMRKGQDDLLAFVNAVIAQMKANGALRQLHEKYGLVYGY